MSKESNPLFSVVGMSDYGHFNFKPEDFFSISGKTKGEKHKVIIVGQVVTGVIDDSSSIILIKGNKEIKARVSTIEMNNQVSEQAVAGEIVGIELSGIKIQELRELNAL